MNTSLIWNPVYKALEEQVSGGDDILLIIVPFAKLEALKQLDWVKTRRSCMKLVCRWAIEDLISGVSDVEVFPYLNQQGCELYLNSSIHLKLYIFESNLAFNTSGNLTLAGLGYSVNPNVEVGNLLQLTSDDWTKIYQIIATSRRVDEQMYRRFKDYLDGLPSAEIPDMLPDLLGSAKIYSIASLPATDFPSNLIAYYLNPSPDFYTADQIRRGAHDLVTFRLPAGLDQHSVEQRLAESFRKTEFVTAFVEFLKAELSLRFGAVNEWIHRRCEDVPLPYRWEIKENTRYFYNWLAHFYPEISWDCPRHSQVIYWRHL